jgi:pyrimidine deaminase RibD-like protein
MHPIPLVSSSSKPLWLPRREEQDRPWDEDAERFMEEALTLARQMQGRAWPNPAVGCVIVNDGVIVGRGQTQVGGRPHAERVALDNAGELAKGATLYVTLEPCSHWGKTSPCTSTIIDAGIVAVYAALQDPDPRVNGGGVAKLRDYGIDVHVGLGDWSAAHIMRGFFKRVNDGPTVCFCGCRHQCPRSARPVYLRWLDHCGSGRQYPLVAA